MSFSKNIISNFVYFIKKYKLYFISCIVLIALASLKIFLFQYLKIKGEKKAFSQLYPLQAQLEKEIKKIRKEKEEENKKKKPSSEKTKPIFQDLIKKQKNHINKSDLNEKLKLIVEDYKNFILQRSKTRASFFAAFDLIDLYREAKDFKSIKETLLPLVKNISHIGSIESLILIVLGESLIELKNWGDALFYLNKILKYKKNEYLFPNVLLKIALCYEKLNKKNQAISAYKRLIQEFPDSFLVSRARSHLNLLHMMHLTNQKLLEKK